MNAINIDRLAIIIWIATYAMLSAQAFEIVDINTLFIDFAITPIVVIVFSAIVLYISGKITRLDIAEKLFSKTEWNSTISTIFISIPAVINISSTLYVAIFHDIEGISWVVIANAVWIGGRFADIIMRRY